MRRLPYEAEQCPYCYENTAVLQNKAGLRDQGTLDEFENRMFEIRRREPLPVGSLDSAHLQAIHQHLFQDVYEWAGRYRTVRIFKGHTAFCYPEYIPTTLDQCLSALAEECYLANLSPEAFISRAAHYLGAINIIHPFRDGNGRTQMVFFILLTASIGRSVTTQPLTDRRRVIAAMEGAYHGRMNDLEALVADMLVLDTD